MTLLVDAAVDAAPVGSPDWWVARLMGRLDRQARRANDLDAYYRGEQAIPTATNKAVRDSYRRLMSVARTNFAELVVEAVRERMTVTGFRTSATPDAPGDEVAWRLWQYNALDADADLVHRAQLSMAAAYVSVGPGDDGLPVITPEDPRQVVAELDPVRRRRVRAALKVFADDLESADRLFLYLPGKVWKARRAGTSWGADVDPADRPVILSAAGWRWDDDTPERLPIDAVPVVPFLNRADLFSRPQGEVEPHQAVLDRINYTILSRLEVATLQAFRQRAVRGALPSHDAAGREIDYGDVFAADPGALWQLPEGVDLWESGQVDLGPIRLAIRDDVEHLGAVSRTPIHYLQPEGANQSAQGAAFAREGLIAKVRDRLKQTGESWEQVMALAFAVLGDEVRAARPELSVMWEDPERWTLAERADAAAKAEAGGLTWRARMERVWQLPPQDIARMAAERASDALTAALAAPRTPAPRHWPLGAPPVGLGAPEVEG